MNADEIIVQSIMEKYNTLRLKAILNATKTFEWLKGHSVTPNKENVLIIVYNTFKCAAVDIDYEEATLIVMPLVCRNDIGRGSGCSVKIEL